MKPSDLKAPFPWNNRQVLIEDRIFYVPTRCETYDDFSFPGWNHPLLFNNDNPIRIEYCSGNGAWIAEKASANPLINWVAVEKKFTRARKIWSKIKNNDLQNLIVLCGEGLKATHLFLPSESFEAAYINFPDPWPKKRHAKNRLIRPPFIENVWRILKPQATFTLVTDDPDYSSRMIEEMHRHPGFKSCFPDPFYITDLPGYGTSYFELLWREKGKTIRFHQFQKHHG
jgi:tRNA (guanine-N7-)-methyltransferase